MRKLEIEDLAGEEYKKGARRILETRTLDDQAWDDGQGGREAWSVERAVRLMQQARNARTETEWNAALDACMTFHLDLYVAATKFGGKVVGWQTHPNNAQATLWNGSFWEIDPEAPLYSRYRKFYHKIMDGVSYPDLYVAVAVFQAAFPEYEVWTQEGYLVFKELTFKEVGNGF